MYTRTFDVIASSELTQEIHNMLLEAHYVKQKLIDAIVGLDESLSTNEILAKANATIKHLIDMEYIRYIPTLMIPHLVRFVVFNRNNKLKLDFDNNLINYYPRSANEPKLCNAESHAGQQLIYIYSNLIPTRLNNNLSKTNKLAHIWSPHELTDKVKKISLTTYGANVFIKYTFYGDDPDITIVKYAKYHATGIGSDDVRTILTNMITEAEIHKRIVISHVGRNVSKSNWLQASDKARHSGYYRMTYPPSSYMDEFLWENRHTPLSKIRLKLPKLKNREMWTAKIDHGGFLEYKFQLPLRASILKRTNHPINTTIIFGPNNKDLEDIREPEYVDISLLKDGEIEFTFYSHADGEVVFDKLSRIKA